jgi:hypothetical protein
VIGEAPERDGTGAKEHAKFVNHLGAEADLYVLE